MPYHQNTTSCDIFCAVIDNFGDAAVTARLARQLADEHGWHVRLWLDDLQALVALWPGVRPDVDCQVARGIAIHRWPAGDFPDTDCASVVIAAFGCRLPDNYLARMAAHPPCWLNLEYLSAESWVAGCHGLPSPHPRLPLIEYFFFPGFDTSSGGLLREQGLLRQRDAFRADARQQAAFWQRTGLLPDEGALRFSLFGYRHAPLADLLDNLDRSGRRIWCALPAGQLEQAGREWQQAHPDSQVHLQIVPFLAQDDYDQLLWLCDINFVRGEDSLTRAIWAGKPFVWHIYPQVDHAHHAKLDALLQRWQIHADSASADTVRHIWHAWNGMTPESMDMLAWLARLQQVGQAFSAFADELAGLPNMAKTLVNFCQIR